MYRKRIIGIEVEIQQLSLIGFLMSSFFVICFSISLFYSSSPSAQVAIGYMPAYKNLTAQVDNTNLSQLTHINISFLNPDASGNLEVGGVPTCMGGASLAELAYVVNNAYQAGVKILALMAGGLLLACLDNWATLLQPANRTAFVNKVINFATAHNLDGIDVDIEWTVLQSITVLSIITRHSSKR